MSEKINYSTESQQSKEAFHRDIKLESEAQQKDCAKLFEAWHGSYNKPGLGQYLNGSTLSSSREEAFSGDAASLFALVKFEKDGVEKEEILKLGWGEFSKNVFTKGDRSLYSNYVPERNGEKDFHHKALHDTLRSIPFNIYCVSQRDSYFADQKTQEDIFFNPQKYLKENAMFVVKDGEVTMADKLRSGEHSLNYDIESYPEASMMKTIKEVNEMFNETLGHYNAMSVDELKALGFEVESF